jgi:hypothetical protein
MSHSVIDVTNGPGKDDLLRAVTNDDGLLTTTFDTPAGAVEAHVARIEERGDSGMDFTLWGQLVSSSLSGAYFTASYSCESRTGRLALKEVSANF